MIWTDEFHIRYIHTYLNLLFFKYNIAMSIYKFHYSSYSENKTIGFSARTINSKPLLFSIDNPLLSRRGKPYMKRSPVKKIENPNKGNL